MGLEDWMMVEDADEDAPQQRGGGGGGVEKTRKTDDCVSKASKEQALLTSYQLGPYPLSHRLSQSKFQDAIPNFNLALRDCPVSWNCVT